jgi:hypothetical protein
MYFELTSSYDRLKKISFILEKATLGLGKMPLNTTDLDSVQFPTNASNDEGQPLLDRMEQGATDAVSLDEANRFFLTALDEELEKIKEFYAAKEIELLEELQKLTMDIHKIERQEESYLNSLWNPESTVQNQERLSLTRPRSLAALPTLSPTEKITTRAVDEWDEHETNSESNLQAAATTPHPGFLPYLIWSSGSLKVQRQILIKRATSLYVLLSELLNYVEINQNGFSKCLKKYEKV